MTDTPTIPNLAETRACFVIPAKAGIHGHLVWGFCGNGSAYSVGSVFMDSRLRGNDGVV
jgi:hypothetical protein